MKGQRRGWLGAPGLPCEEIQTTQALPCLPGGGGEWVFTLQDSVLSLLKGRPSGFPPGAFVRIGCTQYRVWPKHVIQRKPVFFSFSFFLSFFKYVFIWRGQVLFAACGIFVAGFSLVVVCGQRTCGLSSIGSGFICPAAWRDLSSLTRIQTHIPCNGRWILNPPDPQGSPGFSPYLS